MASISSFLYFSWRSPDQGDFLFPKSCQPPKSCCSSHCETHHCAAVLFMTLSSLEDSKLYEADSLPRVFRALGACTEMDKWRRGKWFPQVTESWIWSLGTPNSLSQTAFPDLSASEYSIPCYFFFFLVSTATNRVKTQEILLPAFMFSF